MLKGLLSVQIPVSSQNTRKVRKLKAQTTFVRSGCINSIYLGLKFLTNVICGQFNPAECVQVDWFFLLVVRWQTGKCANHALFFGAVNGFAQLAKNRVGLYFPAPFLWFFLWTNKERT
jgi:hypothetical protein